MTKKEIYELGYDRGYNIANFTDLPEIGQKGIIFGRPIIIKNIDEAQEVFFDRVYDIEMNNRDFSPFEFMAMKLNELEKIKPYDVWEQFDTGIVNGIRKNWKERSKKFYK